MNQTLQILITVQENRTNQFLIEIQWPLHHSAPLIMN